jgi:hypothetical protein
VMSVSPNLVRYKEYLKRDHVSVRFMPTHSLPELLYIGSEMRNDPDNRGVGFLQELHSSSNIRQRYGNYGGIIRRVLPNKPQRDAFHHRSLADAVSSLKIEDIDNGLRHSLELSLTRSYIVHWTAPKSLRNSTGNTTDDVASEDFKPVLWNWDFESLQTDWASPEAVLRLKLRFAALTREENRRELVRLCNPDSSSPMIPVLFESLALNCFVNARNLKRRFYSETLYTDMVVDTIYCPPDPQFPACEAYYKSKDGHLHLIQVSKPVGRKSCTNVAMSSFLSRVGYPKDIPQPSSIELIYCRKSEQSEWALIEGDYCGNVIFVLSPVDGINDFNELVYLIGCGAKIVIGCLRLAAQCLTRQHCVRYSGDGVRRFVAREDHSE